MTTPFRGRGSSSGLKCVILPALPALATLSRPEHQPSDVGDRRRQVHLLLAAGLGELAGRAVHADRGPGRAVTRIAGDGGVPA
jgi:hypothetical protein